MLAVFTVLAGVAGIAPGASRIVGAVECHPYEEGEQKQREPPAFARGHVNHLGLGILGDSVIIGARILRLQEKAEKDLQSTPASPGITT
jgi:hypothetical protein